MAFTKTKTEFKEFLAEPIKQVTVLAVIAVCIAALALIIAVGGHHGA